MQNPFKRLYEPLILRVDFTEPYWVLSSSAARGWLLAAVAADLVAQYTAGTPGPLTVLASFLTLLIFWTVPARLSGAVGGLYVAQALGSLVVVTSVAAVTERSFDVEAAALIWWGWCTFALIRLMLAYIRTPKSKLD